MKDRQGFSSRFSVGKTSGKFVWQAEQSLTDTKFSSNDLGYFTNNNFMNHWLYMGLRFLEPKAWRNRLNINFFTEHSRLFKPFEGIDETFQNAVVRLNVNTQTKKLRYFGVFADYRPQSNDFYEPRQSGYYYKRGASIGTGGWFGTNEANKYSFFTEVFQRKFINFFDLTFNEISLNNNYRLNSKFTISHSLGFENAKRGLGFNSIINDTTVIAKRKVNTVNHVLNLKYNFTNKMGLNFRARHYHSKVDNKEFMNLGKNGALSFRPAAGLDKIDQNVNYFNIDMVYTWQFAPGSFFNLVWKNATSFSDNDAERRYFKSLGNTLDSDQNNNISVKIIYFLDYLQLKGKRKIQ